MYRITHNTHTYLCLSTYLPFGFWMNNFSNSTNELGIIMVRVSLQRSGPKATGYWSNGTLSPVPPPHKG